MKLPRHPRLMHRLIALLKCTAWIRCDACGAKFGAHEDTEAYFVRNVPHMLTRRGDRINARACDGPLNLPSGGELTVGFDMNQLEGMRGDKIVDFMLWQRVCPWCSDHVRGFYEVHKCKPTLAELLRLTGQARNGPPSKPQSSLNGTAGIPGRARVKS